MSDHTDHVFDAIDGAIRDAETSPDAMRWTPEPEQVTGPSIRLPRLSPEQAAGAMRQMIEFDEAIRQSVSAMFEALADAGLALQALQGSQAALEAERHRHELRCLRHPLTDAEAHEIFRTHRDHGIDPEDVLRYVARTGKTPLEDFAERAVIAVPADAEGD